MAHKGRFKCKNPNKYAGDSNNIVYRSGMELRFMSWLDNHPDIIKWASEEMSVQYYDPVTRKKRRYFPDMVVQRRGIDGSVVTIMIEIKPASQSKPPKMAKVPSLKAKRRYGKAVKTWATNQAKWKAACEFCEDQGWTFQVLNEKHLGIKY